MMHDSLCKSRAKSPGFSSRSRSRVCAMKCLYRYFLLNDAQRTNEEPYSNLRCVLDTDSDYFRCNKDYFEVLFAGIGDYMREILECLSKCLDRPISRVTPVEMAILVVSVFELLYQKNVPAPVVINEAVELAKVYGGTDGYKYVNNVLDKLSTEIKESIAATV